MEHYKETVNEVYRSFGTGFSGLPQDEAAQRLREDGKNALKEGAKKSIFKMILEQIVNPMIIILLAAGAIAAYESVSHHQFPTDTLIILIVVVINTVLGVVQESKAEKSIDALKKMSSPFAKVKRDNEVVMINSEDIVKGDIILLEAGDLIPADMRLIECASLKCEESALTGESVPVEKHVNVISDDKVALGDQKNMAFMGSSVSYGRGMGVVTKTGMDTQMGKIADAITSTKEELTPLQKKLEELSKVLSIGVIIVCILVFGIGALRDVLANGPIQLENFMIAISLAVAAIPEGLVTVVTIVLALGVQRMARRNAIIRKLPAVETLGCTQVICSDKTGTLTQNKMTVEKVYIDDKLVDAKNSKELSSIEMFVKALVLCNDSKMSVRDEKIKLLGDPTETALISFAHDIGYDKRKFDQSHPRHAEIPFDSDRKLMTTINPVNDKRMIFTKGAPDVLIKRCNRILINGEEKELTDDLLKKMSVAYKTMASMALRVLAAAYDRIDDIPNDMTSENVEKGLVFIGLVGMIDPARPEALEAVKICRKAGIRPIMITGDHLDTAVAIAKNLNIIDDDKSGVISGIELDGINDEDFDRKVLDYSVYARVSPEHKVRIVKAWKKQGKIVAMTGDGVNDAPALKTSDIGVGMGITGTDVSKGVADMILADDNFATIVFAVEEGRKIYSNIRKTVQFLLSCNIGEVIAVFVATLVGVPLLHTIQILWVNLVTDSLPALALGVDPAEADIMEQEPRDANAGFFSGGLGFSIIYQGITTGLLTLASFFIGKNWLHGGDTLGNTMAFATLCLIQLFHSFNVRSQTKSIFTKAIPANKWVYGAFLLCLVLIVMVINVPFLSEVFKVQALNIGQWLTVTAISFIIVPVTEIVKVFIRRSKRNA